MEWSNGGISRQVEALSPGIHRVTVTDANGCTASAEAQITEDILPLQVQITQTAQIPCASQKNATLEATVSGGKAPFSIAWDHGATGAICGDLGVGSYEVSVRDAAGQEIRASAIITEPEALTGEMIDERAATHKRIPDGKATARIRGGTTPYRFAWDNDETSARATSLSVGEHSVTVTDALGCVLILTTEIGEKILPELTAENLEKGEAVRMEKLLFEADSSSIDETSIPTLEELYAFMFDNPTIVVEIGGHTNGLPEHDYCDRLSSERAKAVASYIIGKGIDEKRILYKGYGKRQPIATNMTPEGRRRNQRVEVRIVKLTE
jgi:outer membrane protein OmpA-like peptidoglycan-associated protein